MIALAALAVTALLVVLEYRHARERASLLQALRDERVAADNARAQATPDLSALIELVDRLCQRIQAPEIAVGQHLAESSPVSAPQAIPMDNDEAFVIAKEELAERMMAEELAARA